MDVLKQRLAALQARCIVVGSDYVAAFLWSPRVARVKHVMTILAWIVLLLVVCIVCTLAFVHHQIWLVALALLGLCVVIASAYQRRRLAFILDKCIVVLYWPALVLEVLRFWWGRFLYTLCLLSGCVAGIYFCIQRSFFQAFGIVLIVCVAVIWPYKVKSRQREAGEDHVGMLVVALKWGSVGIILGLIGVLLLIFGVWF